MNKEVLEAQLELYKKGREQAFANLDKVKAEINAFNGAIEACTNLLNLEKGLQPEVESKSEEKKEV